MNPPSSFVGAKIGKIYYPPKKQPKKVEKIFLCRNTAYAINIKAVNYDIDRREIENLLMFNEERVYCYETIHPFGYS